MLKKIFLGLSLLSFAVTASAQTEGLAPKDVADYNAVARLDAYGTDQLWNEFFTLPSGVSAYDNNDFADKGITFTYENSNPRPADGDELRLRQQQIVPQKQCDMVAETPYGR